MADEEVFTCDGCGDILEVGVPHDCPVTGTVHLIEERA